ncbi:MAG: DUF3489 domain-containing protein [Hyphomicrobium sp.]
MTNVQVRTPSNSKPVVAPRITKTAPSKSAEKAQPKPIIASKSADSQQVVPITKLERLLALFSKPDGATIAGMIDANDWQQHSVLGFLAGTVKKKRGLTLTFSKADGDIRR